MSSTRRLLALCTNLAAARSQLLPWEFRRWASLLQTGGGSKELQAAVHACAAELEAVETRLAGAYIDHKQVGVWRQPPEHFAVTPQQIGRCAAPADCWKTFCHDTVAALATASSRCVVVQAILDEVMEQLLFMDGTLWEAAPPPTGLRPVVLDLIHTLVAVQASVPALVNRSGHIQLLLAMVPF